MASEIPRSTYAITRQHLELQLLHHRCGNDPVLSVLVHPVEAPLRSLVPADQTTPEAFHKRDVGATHALPVPPPACLGALPICLTAPAAESSRRGRPLAKATKTAKVQRNPRMMLRLTKF